MWLLRNPMIGLAAGLFMWGSVQHADKVALTDENAGLMLALDGCSARATSILKDKESDDAIDRLTPDDLRRIPDAWRLPVD
jgi:hypothetical protein